MLTGQANLDVVDYAQLLSRWGVIYDRPPWGVRIIVPPAGWKHLPAAYFWIPALLLCAIWFLMRQVIDGQMRFSDIWPGLVIYGLPIPILLAIVLARVRRVLYIAVSRDELGVAVLHGTGGGRLARWARSEVTSAGFNRISGKLLLRFARQDMLELFISPNPAVAHAVSALTERALHEDASAWHGEADWGRIGQASSVRYWVVTSIFAAAALAGVVFQFTGHPVIGGTILALTCAAAVVALGIHHGTQEKKFFC